ncbi:unnamed protein product [Brachionus calyciflorus]|uniref:Uncharacterized protein n=1 Tax=Brachionus calyciflorus TaxID=104777 RepID=A0A814D4W9_9BILA|nr:unnamed protein product [Brachionus calyciflorus]
MDSVNIITDIWSNASMCSFIAFAVHGKDEDFEKLSDSASNMVKALNKAHLEDYIESFHQLYQSIDEKVAAIMSTDRVKSEDKNVKDVGDENSCKFCKTNRRHRYISNKFPA